MGQQHQADRIPNDRSAGRIGELAAFAATGAGSGYSGPEKPDRRDLTRFGLSRTGFFVCASRRPILLATGNGSSRRTVRVLSLCPGKVRYRTRVIREWAVRAALMCRGLVVGGDGHEMIPCIGTRKCRAGRRACSAIGDGLSERGSSSFESPDEPGRRMQDSRSRSDMRRHRPQGRLWDQHLSLYATPRPPDGVVTSRPGPSSLLVSDFPATEPGHSYGHQEHGGGDRRQQGGGVVGELCGGQQLDGRT